MKLYSNLCLFVMLSRGGLRARILSPTRNAPPP